jgi:hypothetical protein
MKVIFPDEFHPTSSSGTASNVAAGWAIMGASGWLTSRCYEQNLVFAGGRLGYSFFSATL